MGETVLNVKMRPIPAVAEQGALGVECNALRQVDGYDVADVVDTLLLVVESNEMVVKCVAMIAVAVVALVAAVAVAVVVAVEVVAVEVVAVEAVAVDVADVAAVASVVSVVLAVEDCFAYAV